MMAKHAANKTVFMQYSLLARGVPSDGEPIHQQDKVSTTDPDSTYLTKGNRAAEPLG